MERRVFEGIEPDRIKCFPVRELIHQSARRLGVSALTRYESGWASFDSVSKVFDERVARLIRRRKISASAVYAYEYAALRSFEAAADVGMRRCYELPIGYWRAGLSILSQECERRPEWAATVDVLRDSDAKRMRKDAELEAANHVIVPSDFVRDTLEAHPRLRATVDVIPYGAPAPRVNGLGVRERAAKLRLLFVGHLSQRKGISYLFEAVRRLGSAVTLTLIGQKPEADCAALTNELSRHQWLGTVPHSQVLEIMAQHDVFVFPSLFEGFALVLLEAMAQGLPVITTRNSGGQMAVDHGTDGFIVPIRDPDAIAECASILAEDRQRLEAMSHAALLKAAQMSWAKRQETFVGVLRARLGAGVT